MAEQREGQRPTYRTDTRTDGGAGTHAAVGPVQRRRIDGPASSRLGSIAAALAGAPPVQRLSVLSGVVQRVITPEGAAERLIAAGVPREVVDNYHRLATSHSEDEVRIAHTGPTGNAARQSHFPKLVTHADGRAAADAAMVFRGMSVQNIDNLKRAPARAAAGADAPIFTTRAADDRVTPLQHVLDNHPASPFLSFETAGFGISAAKYAPKQVDPAGRPLGMTRDENGFLTQDKSYGKAMQERYPDAPKRGYVAGIHPAGLETLDLSTDAAAAAGLTSPAPAAVADASSSSSSSAPAAAPAGLGLAPDPPPDGAAAAAPKTVEDARRMAVADREVLVKPGAHGVPHSRLGLVMKVEQRDQAYYESRKHHQTATHAVGFEKGKGGKKGAAKYVKMQIRGASDYRFDHPAHATAGDRDGEDISDVESLDLEDEARDGEARDGEAHDGEAHDGEAHDGEAHDGEAHDGEALGSGDDGRAADDLGGEDAGVAAAPRRLPDGEEKEDPAFS